MNSLHNSHDSNEPNASHHETSPWVAEARRLAPLLETQNAVVISGPDALGAAEVALELARIHSVTRRVAVADLVGEAPALQSLLGADDDPHGIADSFLYGVSLNRIARVVDGSTNLFLLPSGSEPVALEAVYRNDRWRRLGAGFHQVGALLLVVAVRDVPGFDALCQYVGALLPVRDPSLSAMTGVNVLRLPEAPPTPEVVRKVAHARTVATEDRGQRRSRALAIAAAAAAVLFAGVALWPSLSTRLGGGGSETMADADTTGRDGSAAGIIQRDSAADDAAARGDSLAADGEPPVAMIPDPPAADSVPAVTRRGPLVVANASDSASAASFAVYFLTANVRDEALPTATLRNLGAAAVSPVSDARDRAIWYRLTLGAATDSAQAVALVERLRSAGEIGETSGSIIRVPYAFRLQTDLTVATANDALLTWNERGVQAYALRQTDGTVVLYTGAFQTPAQATLLADSLAGAGITPVLVFRTGRTF